MLSNERLKSYCEHKGKYFVLKLFATYLFRYSSKTNSVLQIIRSLTYTFRKGHSDVPTVCDGETVRRANAFDMADLRERGEKESFFP